MRTTIKQRFEVISRLRELGISFDDAQRLRRISMTLQRWYELECGSEHGCIERDEKTGTPMWYNPNARYLTANDPRCYSVIPDREKGALKRLKALMAEYQDLTYYVQTDPRGCALFILRKDQVEGHDIEQVYNRGVAVY